MSITDITKKFLKVMNPNSEGEPLPDIDRPEDQGLDEQKIVNYVKEKVEQVNQTNSRIALSGVYLTNVAYLLGFDGIYYDTTYRQFKNIDSTRKITRNRFKVNKILPTVQNRLARITQSPPKYDVRPKSNSTDDKDAARLGLDILNCILDKLNFEEKRQDLHMASMQGGPAYVQVYWNPELGEPMFDPETHELVGYEGDVDIEVLNCLEVFPDPLARSLEESAWHVKAKVRKLDYFRERYERGHAVKEESAWLISSFYDLKTNALTSVGVAGASTSNQMKDSAIELTYYEKRSKEHPNGRMIVTANGVLLEDKDLPIGEYDIVKFDDVVIGSRYYSEAIITHLRPIQDQYNIIRSRCADWVKKLLAGKYLAAKGAGLSQEALNDQNGEVVEYNPVPNASPPTAMNIPMIPNYVYEDIKVLDEEFNQVSGIGEISQGISPGSSIPWRAMALLQEQDQTRISVQTKRNEVGYAKVGAAILKYVANYYVMPRMFKIAGDGMEYAVREFVGAMLKENTDVICIPGSTIPNSKVMKRQDILNAYQSGLLGDPQDPKLRSKVLSMMEFGDVSEMWKEQALDMGMVKKTIDAIENSDQPPLHEWDNHQLILEELNSYRKTDKYDQLDEQQKKMFEFTVEWHTQAIVDLTNPGIAQQQRMAELMVHHGNQQAAQMTQQLGVQGQGSAQPGPGMAGTPPNLEPNQPTGA